MNETTAFRVNVNGGRQMAVVSRPRLLPTGGTHVRNYGSVSDGELRDERTVTICLPEVTGQKRVTFLFTFRIGGGKNQRPKWACHSFQFCCTKKF